MGIVSNNPPQDGLGHPPAPPDGSPAGGEHVVSHSAVSLPSYGTQPKIGLSRKFLALRPGHDIKEVASDCFCHRWRLGPGSSEQKLRPRTMRKREAVRMGQFWARLGHGELAK